MYISPAHQLLLRRARPDVRLLDVRDSVSALTTYTFTAVNIGDLGTSPLPASSAFNNDQRIQMPSNKAIVINIHAEDAATAFSVSSCTLGGVAGIEVTDRGGATNAINTAQYIFTANAIQGITNTDVAVTFSEAITSCAIGVMVVDNFTYVRTTGIGTSTVTGTGASNIGGSSTANENGRSNMCAIVGTTCATASLAETVIFGPYIGNNDGSMPPILLYEGSNAQMSYAGAWCWAPGIGLTASTTASFPGLRVDWSGAGAYDAACCAIV